MNAPDWIERSIGAPCDDGANWITVPYRFGTFEFQVARPREPDRLLDDPAVQTASRESDYMPYWAYLWPGAALLAERLAAEPSAVPAGTRVLEIGCGLGMAGLVALRMGCHVTFTDYSPAALALASHNARLNGFDRFHATLVDWKSPPIGAYDLVLGADVLYEPRCLPDVLRVLDRMLARGGRAWLSDPNRAAADPFAQLAGAHGYCVHSEPIESAAFEGRTIRGRLFDVSVRAGIGT